MEPTPADHSQGRIPDRSASPQPERSAAQAAAFRRTLDEQTTSHDETMLLPPVPDGPVGPPGSAVPAVIPPVPEQARPRSVRLIDAERRDRRRPGRPAAAGPQPPAGPDGYGAGAAAPPAHPQPSQLPPTQFQPTQMAPVPGGPAQGSPSPDPGFFEPTQAIAVVPPHTPVRPAESAHDLAVPSTRVLAAAEEGPSRDLARSGGRGGAIATAGAGSRHPGGRKRHSAGNRPARLPAVIGVCAALAMVGGLVLILTNGGLSPNPTAPVALPATTQQIVIAGGTGAGSLGSSAVPQATPTAAKSSSPPVRATGPATGEPTAPTRPTTRPPAPPTPTRAGPSASPSSTFQQLSQGSSGALVVQLQGRLQQAGYLIKSGSRGYGSVCERNGWDAAGTDATQTTDAVYQFQRNYDDFAGGSLQANGVCNLATWQALFNSPVAVRDCYGAV